MAIDPLRLVHQQRAVARGGEARCLCGTRTRDASGRCRACRITLPKVPTMRTEDLVRLANAVNAELTKRRAVINAALGEP